MEKTGIKTDKQEDRRRELMKGVSTEVQIQTKNKAQKTTGIKTDSKGESRKERIKEKVWHRGIDTIKIR